MPKKDMPHVYLIVYLWFTDAGFSESTAFDDVRERQPWRPSTYVGLLWVEALSRTCDARFTVCVKILFTTIHPI